MRYVAALLVVGLIAAECSKETGDHPTPRPSVPTDRPDTRTFDPSSAAVGDSILSLRIESMDVAHSPVDSGGWIGVVEFAGDVGLSGTYRPHPEFPELQELCFYPDATSARALPRFPNDERYSWLCFTNQDAAWERLAGSSPDGPASIVVDRFRYHYTHSDVYNTARLKDVEPISR